MNTAKHKIWIKKIDDTTFSIAITYNSTVTKESLITNLEAVRERVAAFKLLYDGDFEVVSDVNFH